MTSVIGTSPPDVGPRGSFVVMATLSELAGVTKVYESVGGLARRT